MADSDGLLCFPDLSYGIGMVIRVVEGSPEPDMSVPGAVEAGDRNSPDCALTVSSFR